MIRNAYVQDHKRHGDHHGNGIRGNGKFLCNQEPNMQLYAWKLYWLQCRPVFHQQYILEIELKLAARNRSGRFLKKRIYWALEIGPAIRPGQTFRNYDACDLQPVRPV